jgi:hypothetical protein
MSSRGADANGAPVFNVQKFPIRLSGRLGISSFCRARSSTSLCRRAATIAKRLRLARMNWALPWNLEVFFLQEPRYTARSGGRNNHKPGDACSPGSLCQRDALLGILRCLRRSQCRGSEIHAESFAPYGHGAAFSQVQVAANHVVLVAEVALEDSQIDETSRTLMFDIDGF